MDALAQFDADVSVRAPKAKGEKPAAAAAPTPMATESVIPNGLFTITFPDGSHKTLKIRRIPDNSNFAPGKRTLSLLIGPDNTQDYEQFAFVTETGVQVWKNKRGGKERPSKFEQYAMLIWDMAVKGEALDGYELEISKRCLRCNRTLSTPESLAAGIGPECVKKAAPADPSF